MHFRSYLLIVSTSQFDQLIFFESGKRVEQEIRNISDISTPDISMVVFPKYVHNFIIFTLYGLRIFKFLNVSLEISEIFPVKILTKEMSKRQRQQAKGDRFSFKYLLEASSSGTARSEDVV